MPDCAYIVFSLAVVSWRSYLQLTEYANRTSFDYYETREGRAALLTGAPEKKA